MKSLRLVIGAITLVVLASSCATKRQPPAADTHMYVYKFAPARALSADTSRKLIETLLGRRDVGSLYRSDEDTVYFVSREDVNETFEQDLDNGNFSFNRGMKKYMGDYTPRLPDRENAIKAAQEFLRQNDLLPKNPQEFRLAHYGGLRSSSVIGGRRAGPVVDKLVTVTYGRSLDDVPVIGAGSKVVVNVGDAGEITGLIYRWRELDRSSKREVQPEELISQQEAQELAKRQIAAEYGAATSYEILGSGKAYYDNNGSIVQPVYVFETNVRMPPPVAPFNYLCVIPMLRHSPEPLNLTAVNPKALQLIADPKRIDQPLPKRGSKAYDRD